MKPRRAHRETRSSMRSRRRRFAGWSLDMAPRLGSGALYGASEAHAIEEALAAQLDADMEALESTHQLARLFGCARGEHQAIELAHVERERTIERAQRAEVHRHDPAAPNRTRVAHGPAV